MYRDLTDDIIVNGPIGKGFSIKNGVKQGDALSCSLFILAMEPLVRNILANDNIRAFHSNHVDFTWPKALVYADDITIIMRNDPLCVLNIFHEYERLSRASVLKLNADKLVLPYEQTRPIMIGNLNPGIYWKLYFDRKQL